MNYKISFSIFVIAVLSTTVASITFITTPAVAQTTGSDNANNQNFNDFMTCLLDNNGDETLSRSETASILNTTGNAPTEAEIRSCFAPLYNDNNNEGTDTDDNNGEASDSDEATTDDNNDAEEDNGNEDNGSNGGY